MNLSFLFCSFLFFLFFFLNERIDFSYCMQSTLPLKIVYAYLQPVEVSLTFLVMVLGNVYQPVLACEFVI